jgi:superfamily II DNA or RNA helicase
MTIIVSVSACQHKLAQKLKNMNLRKYQTDLIGKIRSQFSTGHNRVIMQSATGSGKTIMFTYMVKIASERGNKCLILTDRIELLEQAGGTFSRIGLEYQNITANTKAIPNSNVLIAMVETIKRRCKNRLDFQMLLKSIDVLIIDECFVAGTVVDNELIEKIKIGDCVNSFNHRTQLIEKKKVINTFKNKIIDDLLLIKTSYGIIKCTKNHPIFVKEKGYISACQLLKGDIIYGRSYFELQKYKSYALRTLWKRNNDRTARKKQIFNKKARSQKKWKSFLFWKLRQVFSFKNVFRKDEKKQSYVFRNHKNKSIEQVKRNWTQAKNTWGEWSRINKKSKNFIRKIRHRLVCGISYNYRKWLFTSSLQDRYRQSKLKNSYRDRWDFSQINKNKESGLKKREFLKEYRVESIEIYKHRNTDEFNENNANNFVYNLEVEGNNNYFANNILVHNCHKASFDEVFQYLNENCYVIGATATPIRTNAKKPLKDYFSQIVTGIPISNLIEQGYLSRPEYFGVPVDLSKVKIKAGEFDENDMTKLYSEVKLFEGLKHNLDKHAKGLKTMIFCPSVASSLNVSKELNCLHVDGMMQLNERDKILTAFENTPGSILSNCAITTTGYDCPDIECIVLYRATTSLPLYLQMIGRGSRATETKKTFKILDFGMNVQRFGYWHMDRIWSLETPKKKSKKKDTFSVKFCPQCGAILAAQIRTCEYCGYTYPVAEKERMFMELEKLTYTEVQKAISKAESVEEMEAIRLAKGYKIGFLLHRFERPEQFFEYEKLKGYKKGWSQIQMKNYLHL